MTEIHGQPPADRPHAWRSSRGPTYLTAAQRAGVEIVASCGGLGICSTCKVSIAQGRVTPPTLTERKSWGGNRWRQGFRLACQTDPAGRCAHRDPARVAGRRTADAGGRARRRVCARPGGAAFDLELTPPALDDLRGDLTRVNDALARAGCPPLAERTRSCSAAWRCSCAPTPGKRASPCAPDADGSALVIVLPHGARMAGLAMDIGSTKLAMFLVDLESGAILAQVWGDEPANLLRRGCGQPHRLRQQAARRTANSCRRAWWRPSTRRWASSASGKASAATRSSISWR